MKNQQQEAFERVLNSTLARVVDFLKFAEAKNAALLTFESAWILGSVNLLNGSTTLKADWRIAFSVALPLFTIAAFFAIMSFLPKTILAHFHKDPEQTRSLLYFGDIASFAPAAYKERVRERYYPTVDDIATRNYFDDLSIQIAVNSQITTRKLELFMKGVIFVLAAISILVIPAARSLWALTSSLLGGAQ